MHFIKKHNNVQAFVNLLVRPIIMLFCRQCFLQEVFVRLYFLVNSQQEKSVSTLQMISAFTFGSSILLLLSEHILF